MVTHGEGSQRSPIVEVYPFYLCKYPLTQKYQISRGNTYGNTWGGVPALPNCGGSFLFMQTPFDAEIPNFKW